MTTTALVAFRRAIDQQNADQGRPTPGYISAPTFLADGLGAWPRERETGMGFRVATAAPGWSEDPLASRHTEARRGAAAMRARAFERPTTVVHALGDPPRLCWACVDDVVNAPDEPMGEHDPEVAGTDVDGEYCVCGHHLERVASSGFFTPGAR